MGNHDLAIRDFSHAINNIDPKYSDALYYLGRSYLEKNQIDEAFNAFNKAVSIGDFPGLYDGLGQCCQKQGDHEEAIKWFDDAIEKCPDDTYFRRNRARC
jgi:tetratricopeptide (TPR) repeat protein